MADSNHPDNTPDLPGDDESGNDSGQNNPFADAFSQMFSSGGIDPEQLSAAGIPTDPATLQQVFAQVQQWMSNADPSSPINWKLAQDTARAKAAGDDPSVSAVDVRAVDEAFRLAQLWLDEATSIPTAVARAGALSRAEWVEQTMPTWKSLAGPVASSVSRAMSESMLEQAPEEMRGMLAGAGQMMQSVGGSIYGTQLGQAVGTLAGSVLTSTEIGLPLLGDGHAALLPHNIAAFAGDIQVSEDDARIYLAVREDAHIRLFEHAPWLRSHVLTLVEEYARGVQVDTSRLEDLASKIDMNDPSSITDQLSSGMFEMSTSETQKNALKRLETTLALIEGWVDEVTHAATSALASRDSLRESMRRRRAAGGPAENTFATLVGLELRPRRLRDAAALWATIARERGAEARDAVWSHPDLLPDASDLDDPLGYYERREKHQADSDAMDAALRELIDDEQGGNDKSDDDKPGNGEPGN
ncbi:zinc-dependent metalloprotease [Spelaeicoccus albus]|uniref:Putative hydrolase n=1 Tax=Spelaeicoccus albus TaxID=1280376 RepID=A0A7Z0D3B9_9MICO|nr:zinc-dependent metalloprotease [Spelaeicoccus albus]NYI68111.1 putative hydrolase [Spelaeicoccus albus]